MASIMRVIRSTAPLKWYIPENSMTVCNPGAFDSVRSSASARRRRFRCLSIWLVPILLAGCSGVPDGVDVVTDFELRRYLGTWYEIARLDHSFERGLSQVTATYRMREDGGISVSNLRPGSGTRRKVRHIRPENRVKAVSRCHSSVRFTAVTTSSNSTETTIGMPW